MTDQRAFEKENEKEVRRDAMAESGVLIGPVRKDAVTEIGVLTRTELDRSE
jgi:hypothetical protein